MSIPKDIEDAIDEHAAAAHAVGRYAASGPRLDIKRAALAALIEEALDEARVERLSSAKAVIEIERLKNNAETYSRFWKTATKERDAALAWVRELEAKLAKVKEAME